MTTDDFKSRFIARMTSQGVNADIAENEHAAWIETYANDLGTPEHDADEAMSCWSE